MKQRRLKVYGGLTFDGPKAKQVRTVVAAYNMKQVAEAVGESLYYIRGWWTETGNEKDIEAAMKKPLEMVVME